MASRHADTKDSVEGRSSAPGDIESSRPKTESSISSGETENLSLYEKKCILINRELDSHGMGKYQWYIWCLCGFGYLLDLLWAQAFGLVLQPLRQEMGFPANESGNISVAFSSGLTAGAFVWGFLVDIIGWYSDMLVTIPSSSFASTDLYVQDENGPSTSPVSSRLPLDWDSVGVASTTPSLWSRPSVASVLVETFPSIRPSASSSSRRTSGFCWLCSPFFSPLESL